MRHISRAEAESIYGDLQDYQQAKAKLEELESNCFLCGLPTAACNICIAADILEIIRKRMEDLKKEE